MNYWKSVHNTPSAIMRILNMWGLKSEDCREFIALQSMLEYYESSDGTPIIEGHKYVVVAPCWLLTDSSTRKKEIIVKGIVNETDQQL